MDNSGFSIMFGRDDLDKTTGFKIFFPNEYCISVLFGENTDSDDVQHKISDSKEEFFSKTAEVAVLNPYGHLVPFKNGMVKTRVTPEEIPQIMSWAINK